jgi:tetratricopeptide (TPR) repeat protein
LALDREDTLKKAEKLLRTGRLDAAIAEYVRVVEDQPKDWNTANTLGDLYMRAGQSDKAVGQYARIADHFFREGFYPKAAALYKKILKITPDDEAIQLNLAELSAKQGLLADAKSYLTAVGSRRRARGDRRGAEEIVIRLGGLDPSDFEARLAAARAMEQTGEEEGAAARFRELYDDLNGKGREADALAALRDAVRLSPGDTEGRAILAKAAVASGDIEAARGYLDRETAGSDPSLLLALLEIELRSAQLDRAREILPELLAIDDTWREKIIELGWTLCESNAEAAFTCIDAAVSASTASSDFETAASMLQEFVTRRPGDITALLRLVEICVDGGLETTMYETQAALADAYLKAEQPAEARVIAEDLVAREPWERAHIERFRRALVMLRVPEPDSVIAERLSGQTPFTATDHFSDAGPDAPADQPPAAAAAPAPEPPSAPVEPEPVPDAPIAAAARPPAPPPSAAPPRPAAPKRGSMEIDLTSVLGEMEGAFSIPAPTPAPAPAARDNLDDVFKGFRDEVSRQVGVDQSAQHMKLAQTYLEMGMLDEATASLKTAARSPRQRFEAGVMLGRLYKKQGDSTHAIEWFERAAEVPAPTADEGRALLYNLGAILEEVGETARALAVFLELQSDAGDYRDVAARVDRLARVQTGG